MNAARNADNEHVKAEIMAQLKQHGIKYRQVTMRANTYAAMMREDIRLALKAGISVTDISRATRFSRKSIYRAIGRRYQ